MSKHGNNLKPKFRFPKFENSKGWILEQLGELYSFRSTNSYSRDKLNYQSGIVKNIHYGDIHTKFSTLFDITKERVPFVDASISFDNFSPDSFCKEGDLVFADASEDMTDIGKSIELVNLNNEKIVSGLHTLLARQKEPKLLTGFGGYLFLSPSVRKQIQRESQGSKVLGISPSRLSKIVLFYPDDKQEQQKIAACLSSLDDLITAENQKLEALKAHKNGLLQNLFPSDGETVPKLRFKEFEECEDWKEDTLESFCGNIGSGKDRNVADGQYELYGSTGIIGKTNKSSVMSI